MNPAEARESLRRFITRHDANANSDHDRRVQIRRYFAEGHGEVPEPLRVILDWVRHHPGRIELFLLWGSYVRGDECERSFAFEHDRRDVLLCGPSDVDGLLVCDPAPKLPRWAAEYSVLDRHLNVTGSCSLDLYRDILRVSSGYLREALESRIPRYRSCIVDAYQRAGVTLIAANCVRSVFEDFSGQTDHAANTGEVMEQRFADFRRFLS
jgi:hypothetical protein